ncbi:MAG TPA: hypothetical protein VMC02_11885, partial [Steroidobacteraceae bacterium]|nr:hypothetical protein [Steroidobacteraceae bacterium]
GSTAFAPFPESSNDFGNESKSWMVNFRAVAAEGREVVHPRSGPGADAAGSGGVSIAMWRIREFQVIGRGTLMLVGWAVLYRFGVLLLYALGVATLFHLRVLLAEEPAAARRFADTRSAYRSRTPRWLRWKLPPQDP